MSFWPLDGPWSVDLGTVAVLAVVLWLDGWRRAAVDSILLVRIGVGPWTVRPPWAQAGPFALVAWWSPVVLPMVVNTRPAPATTSDGAPWGSDFDTAVARARRRLRRVRGRLATVRALGTILVLWIVFGIPLWTSRFGGAGLLRGIAAAFVIAGGLAALAAFGLRALGWSWRGSLRRAVHLLSPFSACQAAEVVAAAALDGLDPVARVGALLGDTPFLTWVRPFAYDALHGRLPGSVDDNAVIAAHVRDLPRSLLEQAARAPSAASDGDVAYCPRCARTYRADVAVCADCGEPCLVE